MASYAMTLTELELQAMALPVEERKKLGAKLLASTGAAPSARGRRRAGSAAGRVHLAHDFDSPLEDFAEYS
jgi:hypothetical protein